MSVSASIPNRSDPSERRTLVFASGGDVGPLLTMTENTPLKINMEHNHRGLEDHFPF